MSVVPDAGFAEWDGNGWHTVVPTPPEGVAYECTMLYVDNAITTVSAALGSRDFYFRLNNGSGGTVGFYGNFFAGIAGDNAKVYIFSSTKTMVLGDWFIEVSVDAAVPSPGVDFVRAKSAYVDWEDRAWM